MKNSATPKIASDSPRQPRTLATVWRGLIEPASAHSEPERRRSRVLALIILVLLISAGLFLVLIFVSTPADQRGAYVILIAGLLGLFAAAFRLNHTGHYSAAVGLIVACTVLGSWFAILFDLAALSSDPTRLSYIAVSILLCSILLPTRVTVVLSAAQVTALWLLSLLNPVVARIDTSSALGFIIFISLLSIVANYISRTDLDQIDQQTRQLLEDEARLRELSVRDPLTELFNRRYLEETLARELSRAGRKQLPLGVIMLDIDHFKGYNDAHGHPAGDVLLQRVSGSMQRHIRAADILCRYGGEEFLAILPDAPRDVTRERAEAMLKDVKQLRIHFQNQILEAVTLSVGVAVFPTDGATEAAVLSAADAALYQAKREGRDRVVVASQAINTSVRPSPDC